MSDYIEPTKERDDMDLIMLALGRLRLSRCAGGRIIEKDPDICAICGIDMRANPGFCGQPLQEDGYTPFDATVAKRIMDESAEPYQD